MIDRVTRTPTRSPSRHSPARAPRPSSASSLARSPPPAPQAHSPRLPALLGRRSSYSKLLGHALYIHCYLVVTQCVTKGQYSLTNTAPHSLVCAGLRRLCSFWGTDDDKHGKSRGTLRNGTLSCARREKSSDRMTVATLRMAVPPAAAPPSFLLLTLPPPSSYPPYPHKSHHV